MVLMVEVIGGSVTVTSGIVHGFGAVGRLMNLISFLTEGLQMKTVECSCRLIFVHLYHLR